MSAKQGSWLDLLDKVTKSKYRLPKKGDRLLREAQDRERGVTFPNDEISRHVFIWDGYMKAGELLVQAGEEQNYERHFLVYPILFNYRHAIELAIKWVITQYGSYSTVPVDDIEHHNLWKLWQICKQIIIEVGSESEAISIVEGVIKEFHDLDKSAQAFRYPSNKEGVPFVLPYRMIDLQNIRDVMEGISLFFNGVDGQLAHNSGAVGW